MSDFIDLTGTEGNKIKFNATVKIIHMIEEARGTNISTADGDILVKESVENIEKKVDEWQNEKENILRGFKLICEDDGAVGILCELCSYTFYLDHECTPR